MRLKLSPSVTAALFSMAETYYDANINRTVENALKHFFLVLTLPEADQKRITKMIDESKAAQEFIK